MASSSGDPQRFPNGSITGLFRFPTAAVVLLDYNEKRMVRLLALGVFLIDLVVQTASSILTTYCSVNGFQWPLAKDAPIIRICKRTFIFGLPGLLYGLQFPSVCQETLIDSLERVFMKFGHYRNFHDPATGGPGYPCADNDPSLWCMVRPLAEPKAHEVLLHFGHKPRRFVTLPHDSCYTRATRMSATTKMMVNAMVSGTLKPFHITVKKGIDEGSFSPANPSISVYTCLVDALEASWLYSIGVPTFVLDMNPPLRTDYPDPGFRVWRLNQMGFTTFIQGLDSASEQEAEMVLSKNAIKIDDDDDAKDINEKGEASDHSSATAMAKGKEVKP